MPLPDRFDAATFDSYEAETPSQADALQIARKVVTECRRSPTWGERLKRFIGLTQDRLPDGLYLVGPAGTGKTHLLASMYHALSPEVSCVFLHSSTLFRQTGSPEDFAHNVADTYSVCCLDEVEIDDPANEMRLVQVMKTLADRGVLLVATSNVEPEQYVSNQFSSGRFQRFLHREFRERYRVVFVGGEDYRRSPGRDRSGYGWIGPKRETRSSMKDAWAGVEGAARWWSFDDLREATTEMAHGSLIEDITAVEHLFVEDISITDTDDALRVLRVIDALYLHRDAPALYFSAEHAPDAWFDPEERAGVAQAVAEKFTRTVSRIHAMCSVETVDTAEEGTPTPQREPDQPVP